MLSGVIADMGRLIVRPTLPKPISIAEPMVRKMVLKVHSPSIFSLSKRSNRAGKVAIAIEAPHRRLAPASKPGELGENVVAYQWGQSTSMSAPKIDDITGPR